MLRTKALDASTGLNQVLADSNTTVVDTVTYTHLLPGKTYVMKGVLMTSAGNALMVNGKTITASTEFVPTTPSFPRNTYPQKQQLSFLQGICLRT